MLRLQQALFEGHPGDLAVAAAAGSSSAGGGGVSSPPRHWPVPGSSAREAALAALDGVAENGEMEPDEFMELLEDVVLCPAFSLELLKPGGPVDRLLCSTDAFAGIPERRQFFRNQMLFLHYDAAAQVRSTLEVLCAVDPAGPAAAEAEADAEAEAATAAGWDCNLTIQGVLNQLYDAGEAPPHTDETDHGRDDLRRLADFTFESERYPFLVAWTKGDFFFLRHRPHGASAAAPASKWVLGRATRVIAPRQGPISLVQLELHALGAEPLAALAALQGMDFELAPVDCSPIVLRREAAAVRALCEAVGDRAPGGCGAPAVAGCGFTEVVRGAVFGGLVVPPPAGCGDGLGADAAPRRLRRPRRPDPLRGPLVEGLNAQQRAAVVAAIGSNPLTLIEGPPGTGKTTVVAAIVEAWLRQDPKRAILVATGTHASRGLLTERLVKAGYTLGRRMEPTKGIRSLERVPVFVETVYMAAEPRSRSLPRVIIDESTQITEAAALVALGQGCDRLVLVGDPNQLAVPCILGRYDPPRAKAAAGDMDQLPYGRERESFFERIKSRHGFEAIRLDTQYRMEPRLRAYPGQRFYDGELVDGLAAGGLGGDGGEPRGWPRGLFRSDEASYEDNPLAFVDTRAEEEPKQVFMAAAGGVSLQNEVEAALVMRLLHKLLDLGVERSQVAILSAYGGQRDLISQLLTRELRPGSPRAGAAGSARWQRRADRLLWGDQGLQDKEPHPRVYTVDSFQGSEQDFVIFSAVRSDAEGSLGFVGDPRRVCVLLTRARRGLLVVGEGPAMEQDEEWGRWLREAGPRILAAADVLVEDGLAPS